MAPIRLALRICCRASDWLTLLPSYRWSSEARSYELAGVMGDHMNFLSAHTRASMGQPAHGRGIQVEEVARDATRALPCIAIRNADTMPQAGLRTCERGASPWHGAFPCLRAAADYRAK